MSTLEMALRLFAGLGCGAVIGVERQWRARGAGLRTNALVATGAALFVLLSAHGFTTGLHTGLVVADPTRIAAQIVSGIGFLGGGVILRDGLNVRGLNTAATLWCAGAVGALCGAGLYPLAALGTGAIIAANVVLRPLGRRLDRTPSGGDETIRVDYRFEAVCADTAEAHIRALLVQALTTTSSFALRAIRSHNTPTDPHTHLVTGAQVSVVAELSADHRDERQLEQAVNRLSLEPTVTAVSWTVQTNPATPSNQDRFPVSAA
jgi:putative Mg2+ transporter-C (MgtC) family protein